MTIPSKPFTFANGTAADAIEVNADFDALYSTLAGNIDSSNIASASINESDLNWGTGANQISAIDVPTASGSHVEGALVPIGTIIPFYDFGSAGPGGSPLTFDTDNWEYCDGGLVASASSPLVGSTKPDLSNRYLVGFGTEGGGDVGTAAWATAAVGNTSHQIALNHTNSTDIAHGHADTLAFTGPSHTHTGPSHTHGPGNLRFVVATASDNGTARNLMFNGLSGWFNIQYQYGVLTRASGSNLAATICSSTMANPEDAYTGALGAIGLTASGGTASTGISGTGVCGKSGGVTSLGSTPTASDSQLSATQSIQPRSIRVRFIMRVL